LQEVKPLPGIVFTDTNKAHTGSTYTWQYAKNAGAVIVIIMKKTTMAQL
jgi:hypothetical protein